MNEILISAISMLLSLIISSIYYIVERKKGVAVLICIFLTLLSVGVIAMLNTKGDDQQEVTQESLAENYILPEDLPEEEVWKRIEINYRLGNYKDMLQLAETYQLMNSETMLNVIGVMHAQGMYYEQSYEEALPYLEAAAVYGESDNTFVNLWLVSFLLDKKESKDGHDSRYDHCIEALRCAEKHGNGVLNEKMKSAIAETMGKEVENAYEYVRRLPYKEKKELFDQFDLQIGGTKYIVCVNWAYRIEKEEDPETGELVRCDAEVIPYKWEERELPVYLMRQVRPFQFVLFGDITLSPFLSQEYTVTATFEYEINYTDAEGNIHYWVDTDEVYYGDVPPETDGDSRWIIDSIEENKRKYRLQVKE